LYLLLIILFVIHLGFHWLRLSSQMKPRFHWGYVVLQGILVLFISMLTQNTNMELGLLLALILEAIDQFHQGYTLTVVLGYYLLLFLVSWEVLWRGAEWNALWSTNTIALFPFVLGFMILSLQQARAQRQVEAYALRVEVLTKLTERQRLARELHDTLSQGVVGLTLQLETVNGLLTRERTGQAQAIVQQALPRARAVLAEARGAIDDLRAEASAALDLPEAVQEEVCHFTTATGIPCQVDLSALPLLAHPLHEHLLRMITEGLTNVARHAQAHHVWVRLAQEQSTSCLEIRDDGIGFDPPAVSSQPGHYGLLGMRERAGVRGGSVDFVSTPDKGTTLRAVFPLPCETREARAEEGRKR
jgi:NarL family two-component system sensor histidine kinase YdfH